MSDKIFKEIRSAVVQAGVQVCWAQWSALGSYATPERTARPISIVDPEALILLSLGLEKEERRLGDMLFWWASVGSRLTSVQRIRTLAKDLPQDVQQSVGRYATLASAAGDRRWTRLAAKETPRPHDRRLKGPEVLNLAEASTLMLRLRAAFGVGSIAPGDDPSGVGGVSHGVRFLTVSPRPDCLGFMPSRHGETAPADVGWAVGVHTSEVLARQSWMTPCPTSFRLISSHKDQVVTLPGRAALFATSEVCPYGGFTIDGHILTFQGHPEFEPGYAAQLMTWRRELLGEQRFAAGMASLEQRIDSALVAKWIVNFIHAANGMLEKEDPRA